MEFIELFAGIGGFRYGLENIRYSPTYRQETTEGIHKMVSVPKRNNVERTIFSCVYSNEWDKYAAEIYERNFNEKPDTRDIREVPAEEIPDHDLLTAGFPCQAFSIAGKRGGFEDIRGTLFFEIARIAKQKQPRLLLLENVKGLLSHDKGKTFGTILNTLDELGYDCQWQVLNSKDFGVPQNRERVFIIGHLRGTSRPEVFPIGESNKESAGEVAYCLDANYWKGVRDIRKKQRTVLAWSKSHRTGKTEADKRRYNYGKVEQRIKMGEFNTLNTGEGCRTQSSQNFIKEHGLKIRRLTPTECERLQGFPDGWTGGISDTQRYRCLGNAVTTNVITAIGNKLKESK